jgi:hypothetical protein
MRRAVQLFAFSLPEEQAAEVVMVFDAWISGRHYNEGEYITYGFNNAGVPQLYRVMRDHTSEADHPPDQATSFYAAIGLDS